MGRAERVDYRDGSSEAYTYFDGGLVETVINADGIRRYSYDAMPAVRLKRTRAPMARC